MKTNRNPHPLTDLEKSYQQYWLSHPLLHLEEPCLEADVPEILEAAGPAPEKTLLDESPDALFIDHARYMPAFWTKLPFFTVLCVTSGNCTLTIGTETFSLPSGDLCFIPPGTRYALSVFSNECTALKTFLSEARFEATFYHLMEGEEILASFFRHAFCVSEGASYLLFRKNRTTCSECLRLAQTENRQSGKFHDKIVNFLVSAAFMTLLQDKACQIEFAGSTDLTKDRRLLRIIEYLQANYEEISQESLAAHFGYSTRQMTRLVKEATGKTFSEIVKIQKSLGSDKTEKQPETDSR